VEDCDGGEDGRGEDGGREEQWVYGVTMASQMRFKPTATSRPPAMEEGVVAWGFDGLPVVDCFGASLAYGHIWILIMCSLCVHIFTFRIFVNYQLEHLPRLIHTTTRRKYDFDLIQKHSEL
jgi:hypothetical protein